MVTSDCRDRVKLRGKLYQIALVRWVDIPKRAVAGLELTPAKTKGSGVGWNALLRFNGDIDRVTLMPGKRGQYRLAFKVELLKAAGVGLGDVIEFTLEADAASREPELPEEIRRAFQARPHLAELWANTASHRGGKSCVTSSRPRAPKRARGAAGSLSIASPKPGSSAPTKTDA